MLALLVCATPAWAQKKYGPGASDAEIKIGNTIAYSGPVSSAGVIGQTQAAYFKMINEQGGINGRKINFISYDDAYSPPKTVEQTRKLVESDEVLAIFNPLGTAGAAATLKYLNGRKVPQLYVGSGATMFGDYKTNPWTVGWPLSYITEGAIYGRHILANAPAAKIGVLLVSDDFGRDSLKGLKSALGPKANMIVAEATYDNLDTTIDTQLVKLQSAGADIIVNFSTPKFAAMAIRRMAEMGWRPTHYLTSVSQSVGGVLAPAGLENSKGVLSAYYSKDPDDPEMANDAGMKKWRAFMDKYMPGADQRNTYHVYGYNLAQTLEHTLRQCGDDLTRENVLRQAENLNLELDMLLPGMRLTTSASDHNPVKQTRLRVFNGQRWASVSGLLSADDNDAAAKK
jgi:branched-chain amino acid transport system substrate-binding protein